MPFKLFLNATNIVLKACRACMPYFHLLISTLKTTIILKVIFVAVILHLVCSTKCLLHLTLQNLMYGLDVLREASPTTLF